MDKVITVSGKEVGFRATARTPRFYRHKIGRDIVRDMNQLQTSFKKAVEAQNLQPPKKDAPDWQKKNYEEAVQHAQLSVVDLEIFENVAWVMARQYDQTLPDAPGEWLDQFDGPFSVYEVLPQILELWQMNQQTTSIPKKK